MIQMKRKNDIKLSRQLPDLPAYLSLFCTAYEAPSTSPKHPHTDRSFFFVAILLLEAAFHDVDNCLDETETAKHHQPHWDIAAARTVVQIHRTCIWVEQNIMKGGGSFKYSCTCHNIIIGAQ